MENVNEVVVKIQAEVENINSRLDNLEDLTKSVHEMAINLTKLTLRQESSENRMNRIANDVEDIKNKPGKRWETAVGICISVPITAFITYIVATFFGK